MKRITSRQNPVVARYRAAARGEAPELLLDGVHLIEEAIAADVSLHHVLVATDVLSRPEVAVLLERLGTIRPGVEVGEATGPVLAAASPVRSPSGIVAIASRPPAPEGRLFARADPIVVIACDVQDPGNLGAIVRAAEAGGASGVACAGASADPFGWKALRGSMGSALRLPVALEPDAGRTVAEARRHRCRIVAAVPRGGRLFFDADLTGPLAILVGSEGGGLSAALANAADERVTIPMQPPVESLNAAVTTALLVYECRRQRRAAATARGDRAAAGTS